MKPFGGAKEADDKLACAQPLSPTRREGPRSSAARSQRDSVSPAWAAGPRGGLALWGSSLSREQKEVASVDLFRQAPPILAL